MHQTINNYQVGWVCPKCGKCLAPWVEECNCISLHYYCYKNPTPEPNISTHNTSYDYTIGGQIDG